MAQVVYDNNYQIIMGLVEKFVAEQYPTHLTFLKDSIMTFENNSKRIRLKMDYSLKATQQDVFYGCVAVACVAPLPDSEGVYNCYSIGFAASTNAEFRQTLAKINSYKKFYEKLEKHEREALLAGTAVALSAGLTAWKGYATVLDWVTPGGPLIPVFGLMATGLGAIATAFSADRFCTIVAEANKCIEEAETALNQMQGWLSALDTSCLNEDLGFTIMDAHIESYCRFLAKVLKLDNTPCADPWAMRQYTRMLPHAAAA